MCTAMALVTVDELCELLETYRGRDKIVRLTCYMLKLWGSVKRDDALLKASSRLSATRMALRLFDDLPQLRHTISYGLGRHEPDIASSVLGVFGNVVDQLFLPVEKVVWLADLGVLQLPQKESDTWDVINTWLWATSLYIALLKTVKKMRALSAQAQCLKLAAEGADAQRGLAARRRLELLTAIKLCIDITHAVNCLPSGYLWGGKLDGTKVGLIATTSSIIGLGLHFARKRYFK